MNRREFLKSLLAFGVSVAFPFDLATATPFNIDTATDAEVDAILDSGDYDFEVNDYGSISFANFVEPTTREDAYGVSVAELQNINDLRDFADSSTLRQRLQSVYELEFGYEPEDRDFGWITWLKESPNEARGPIYAEVERYLAEEVDCDDAEHLPNSANAQGLAYRFFQDEDWELLDKLGIVIVEGDSPGSSYYAAELRIPVAEANQIAKDLGVPYLFKVEA